MQQIEVHLKLGAYPTMVCCPTVSLHCPLVSTLDSSLCTPFYVQTIDINPLSAELPGTFGG